MDKIDFLIFLLPFFGLLDVTSTFYVESLGYPMLLYESGFFAQYFLRKELLYFYVPLYIVILCGMAATYFFIKRSLRPALLLDKIVFLLLISSLFFIEARLSGVILLNFMFPAAFEGLFSSGVLMFVGSVCFLVFAFLFVIDELILWFKTAGNGET